MASKCSIGDIANKLISARKEKKGATLLLGEGCLESSGIPSDKEFVEIIRKTYPGAFEKARQKELPALAAQLSDEEKAAVFNNYFDYAQITWSHLCVALMMKEGFITRVMANHCDPLIKKAFAMMGEFLPEFDCALTQIGHPEKLPAKALIHLYGQEMGLLPESLDKTFKDAGKQRTWIVAGHQGQKDLALEQLKKVKAFEEGIYWVFSPGSNNKKVVMEEILSKEKQGFYIMDQDLDPFFISLTQRLKIFPPLIISHPFTHLGQLLKSITPFPVPGQYKGFSITDFLLLQTQGAIEQYQEVEVGAEDFGANQDTAILEDPNLLKAIQEARNGLLKGDPDQVLKQASQYQQTPSLQLGNILHWAYVKLGGALLSQGISKSGEEALGLVKKAADCYHASMGIYPDHHEILLKYGNALIEQAKLSSGSDSEKLFALAGKKFENPRMSRRK